MSETDNLSDNHELFGKATRWEVVRSDTTDDRNWLVDSPVCPRLDSHLIAHTGRMWAHPPFKVVRSNASGTFALMSLTGEGETLVDGQWRTVGENELCLIPAFLTTGIRAKAGAKSEWSFGWVRYQEEREHCPFLSINSPVIQKISGAAFGHAIAGLVAESSEAPVNQASLHHWVELIHGFIARAAKPYQGDDRLSRVWNTVENNLDRDWTLSELAHIGHLSQEHLRRLSKQQLGRSPIQQVTHLRMQRAVSLLTSTSDKIEIIAQNVGYDSPFTFSNAFKRWTGKRPSAFRD